MTGKIRVSLALRELGLQLPLDHAKEMRLCTAPQLKGTPEHPVSLPAASVLRGAGSPGERLRLMAEERVALHSAMLQKKCRFRAPKTLCVIVHELSAPMMTCTDIALSHAVHMQ